MKNPETYKIKIMRFSRIITINANIFKIGLPPSQDDNAGLDLAGHLEK